MGQNITDLFSGELEGGVYHLLDSIAVGDLEKLSKLDRAQLYYLDGGEISDKNHLFERLAQVMNFPDYFGHNWDALADCLTDLDNENIDRYVLILDRLDRFANQDRQQWETLLDICQSVVAYWQDTETPMYILLGGNSPELVKAGLDKLTVDSDDV
jgi:RNAse (barnase) inhibitor barstar